MLKIALFLITATLFALPADAQTRQPAADQKQCADKFKAADLNNDGVLSSSEMGNAKQTVPAAVANKDRLTQTEFMAACSKGAS
jgi:hypothetical protein